MSIKRLQIIQQFLPAEFQYSETPDCCPAYVYFAFKMNPDSHWTRNLILLAMVQSNMRQNLMKYADVSRSATHLSGFCCKQNASRLSFRHLWPYSLTQNGESTITTAGSTDRQSVTANGASACGPAVTTTNDDIRRWKYPMPVALTGAQYSNSITIEKKHSTCSIMYQGWKMWFFKDPGIFRVF